MKIIDTAGQVGRGFFCQPFDLEKWRAYAAGISPELARMCLEDVAKYDFDRQVAPVLQASLSRPDKLRQLHASFLGAAGALRAAREGRTIYTPKLFYKFYRLLAKVTPVKLMVKFAKT